MNKLTKKVVSLLTVMAFVLTMFPAAAFAAPEAEGPEAALTFTELDNKATAVKVNVTVSDEDKALIDAMDTAVAELTVVNYGDKQGVVKTLDNAAVKEAFKAAPFDLTFTDLPALAIGDTVTVKLLDASGESDKKVIGEVTGFVYPVDGIENPNADGSTAVLSDAAEDEAAELDTNEETEFKIEFDKAYEGGLYIWAEKDANQPHEKFAVLNGEDGKKVIEEAAIKDFDNIFYIENVVSDKNGGGVFFNVVFKQTGTYRVYASTVDPRNKKVNDKVILGDNFLNGKFKATPARLTAVKKENQAVVSDDYVNIKGIGIVSVNSPKMSERVLECGEIFGAKTTAHRNNVCCDDNAWTEDEVEDWILVDPNDTTKSTVKAILYKKRNPDEPVGKGHQVTVSASHPGIKVDNESSVKLVTDKNGAVQFDVTGNTEGEYFVYVAGRNCEVKVPVKVSPLRANTIEKVDSPENPIAAGDASGGDYLSFRILDINGNVIKGGFDKESPILGINGLRKQFKKIAKKDDLSGPVYEMSYEGDFFRILKQPAKAKLKGKDVTITEDDGTFKINFEKDLVVGDYALEVRLDNGQKVAFEFSVKEFGKAAKLEIGYPNKYVELGYTSDEADVKFIDENGVEKDAKKYVSLGANGYAVKAFNHRTGEVTVKNDEKYLGDTIVITAIAPREGLVADTELVVTDGKGGNETLTFDKKFGPVNKVNRVNIQVVDSKGHEIALGADKVVQSMDVVLSEQSNKDAKVVANIASGSKDSLKESGTAELVLKSDKPTTVDAKVSIVAQSKKKGAIHTAFYRGTLHYEFTDKAEFAGRNLVMTINSKDVIVDGKIVTIDAAPIIKEKRTFVPYRALAEAFGAKVDWDNDKRSVAAEMEGKKVVMFIDKQEYTMNSEEAKLDVVPFIEGSRTMIPIRFAAEALGFKVTPTYNADGTTASVVFNK